MKINSVVKQSDSFVPCKWLETMSEKYAGVLILITLELSWSIYWQFFQRLIILIDCLEKENYPNWTEWPFHLIWWFFLLLAVAVSPMMGIYSQVQFGTNNRGRNLAPSLHSSHSNYKLLKRCYSTPAGDNDSTSVPYSSLLLCNGARGATQHRFK